MLNDYLLLEKYFYSDCIIYIIYQGLNVFKLILNKVIK